MYENQDTSPAAVLNGDAGNHIETAAVESNAVALMERVTIDTQIATAKQYPRSLARFMQRAQEMATVDEETAESCIYNRPVGKEKDGTIKYVSGESIRLAEIVAACYGNIRVQGVIAEVGLRQVKAVGICHDLETNYAAKAEAVESVVTQNGRPFSERMRIVVAKAAQSKAMRDAIFRVVPKSLCKPITNLAREVALGKGLTMLQRRERAIDWIASLDIEVDRVWQALGVQGVDDLGNDQLLLLTGLRTAIKDGDATVAEAFPELSEAEPEPPTSGNEALKQRLAGQQSNGQQQPKGKRSTRRGKKQPTGEDKAQAEGAPAGQQLAATGGHSRPFAANPPAEGKLVTPEIQVDPERNAAYGILACTACHRTFDQVLLIDEKYHCRYCRTPAPILTDGYEGEDLLTLSESESDPDTQAPPQTQVQEQQWQCDKGHRFGQSEVKPSARTANGLCPRCLSSKIEPVPEK